MTKVPRQLPVFWVFSSYLALTLVLTYPVIRVATSQLPSDPIDPMLNTWILWWSTQVLPLSEPWWNPPIFFPVSGTFAFSEHLLGLWPIAGPVQVVTGSPVLAYNLTFLMTFPLSGLSAFLLVRYLTARDDAAWIAGLVYAFAPYRFDQLSHLQVLAWYWLPIVLLALHRYLREGRVRWLVLFGTAYLLQGLTNSYLFLFVPVLVALWVVWFVPLTDRWRTAASIAGAGATAAACALPILLRYGSIHQRYGLGRSVREITSFSADLMAPLSPSPHLALWGWVDQFRAPEAQLFPGLTVVCLVVFGVATLPWPRSTGTPTWIVWSRRTCAAVACFFLLAIGSRLAFGPWEMTLLGVPVSVTQLDKPFSFVALFVTALALLSPVVLAAHARRSILGFYLLATIAMWIFTWGPFPTIAEQPLIEHGPYSWLRVVPGYEALRVPARFWILATACLSIASGLIFAAVAKGRVRWRTSLVGLVACGVIADAWVAEMPMSRVPERISALDNGMAGAVLELPVGRPPNDVAAMYRAIYHRRPLANGFSGHTPPHYSALFQAFDQGDPEVLSLLAELGVQTVVLHRAQDRRGRTERLLSLSDVANVAHESQTEMLYTLSPRRAQSQGPAVGGPLRIDRVSASVNVDRVPYLLDGDLTTRWFAGPQETSQELIVDLAEAQDVSAVVLTLGPFVVDSPRVLQVAVSDDGDSWRHVCQGPTAAKVIHAAIKEPTVAAIELSCTRFRTRFIRLRHVGWTGHRDWSVAELRVLGPARQP